MSALNKYGELDGQTCAGCGQAVESDWNLCPKCGNALRKACEGCGKAMEADWIVCPRCGDNRNQAPQKPEIGKVYHGRVVSIREFGCFVDFLPGVEGLVHISELANFRVKQVEDIVKTGDAIQVKCLGIDEKGRVRLSRKAAMEDREREMNL